MVKKIKLRGEEFDVEILKFLQKKYKRGYAVRNFLERVIEEVFDGKEISDSDFRGLRFHYDMELTRRKIGIYI